MTFRIPQTTCLLPDMVSLYGADLRQQNKAGARGVYFVCCLVEPKIIEVGAERNCEVQAAQAIDHDFANANIC